MLRYHNSTNGKKLKETVGTDERFKNVERQAADIINIVTGSNVKYPKGEEAVDMCLAIQEIRAEGEIIGVIRSNKNGTSHNRSLANILSRSTTRVSRKQMSY